MKFDVSKASPEARLFFLCAIAYAAIVLFVISRPLIWLLGYVADDAFYYLQVARHLAESGRSTFDGVNPTNGYHPGWMLILTVAAKLVPTRILLLRAMLLITLIIHALGAGIMKKILERYLRPMLALVIAAGWLFNPFALRLALCGTEGPLATCMALLAVLLALRLSDTGAVSLRRCAVLGLVLGAAVLSRTDQLLLAFLVLLPLGLERLAGRFSVTGTSLKRVAVAAGCAAVVVAPWLLFSYLSVGTLQQDSGVMKQLWLAHQDTRRSLPDGLLPMWLAPVFGGLSGSSDPLDAMGVALMGLFAAFAARSRQTWEPFRALSLWLLAYVLTLGAIYVWRFSDLQIWHWTTSAAACWIVVCGFAALAWEAADSRVRRWTFAAVLFYLAALPILRAPLREPSYVWQRATFYCAPRLQRMVPEGEPIGCFNAGIPTYFSRRHLVNLDGLVNHSIVPYWKRGEVDAYLRQNGIRYIADESHAFDRMMTFCRDNPRFTQVAVISEPGRAKYLRRLWRLENAPR
ncbi:hypothetical protein CCAX7_17440 [Capsulimonas corticalis]|uniref:Uncharacterized protein n=1 Tax=Capsulimonas corticalis TaxID=2219043 RepID=A0A402D3U1_9BACT|nr:hypothetical protein [Capsulimonas corticalis]BDI29693.1 hypothetical protein CCAX7_17440 [Capsulimonas corticalis]